MPNGFELLSEIANVETIAIGTKIRELFLLEKRYGKGRWRKLKGEATVRLLNGKIRTVEVHWYEAHGIGKRKMKIKRFID
jgi:hypothetical protein